MLVAGVLAGCCTSGAAVGQQQHPPQQPLTAAAATLQCCPYLNATHHASAPLSCSYLGYGLMAGRAAVLSEEAEEGHPCVPTGHSGTFEYAGKTMQMKPHPVGVHAVHAGYCYCTGLVGSGTLKRWHARCGRLGKLTGWQALGRL